MKVQSFGAHDISQLDEQINKFLEENPSKRVVDIKLLHQNDSIDSCEYFYGTVLYEEDM